MLMTETDKGDENMARFKEKRSKWLLRTYLIGFVAVAALFVLVWTVVLPYANYKNAMDMMENGDYSDAKAAFAALEDYKDSEQMVLECDYLSADYFFKKQCYPQAAELFAELSKHSYKDSAARAQEASNKMDVADDEPKENQQANQKESFDSDEILSEPASYFTFGKYEQDGNLSNGKEDIQWIVVGQRDGYVLAVSRYVLDCMPYQEDAQPVTWAESSLRTWLNSDFLDNAFNKEEYNHIVTQTVRVSPNRMYGTSSGFSVTDKVFLGSGYDSEKWFCDNFSTLQAKPTAFAQSKGISVDAEGYADWWMITSGETPQKAVCTTGNGVNWKGESVGNCKGVRPVIWVDITA